MSPRKIEPIFEWIPPDRSNTDWAILIGTTDVTDNVIPDTEEFTMGLIGEELLCSFELDNNLKNMNFNHGDAITLKFDYTDATTVQWLGELESAKSASGQYGNTLKVVGSHLTGILLDETFTGEFTNSTITDAIKYVIDQKLASHGYTYTNVETISETFSNKYQDIPLMDVFLDIFKKGNADGYIDQSKDFHVFVKNSKTNLDEAFWEDDGLTNVDGLGTDAIDVRNNVRTYGESAGLPVISTSTDATSTYRTKITVLTNTDITDEDIAATYGDAELEQKKNPEAKGSVQSGVLHASLVPGYKTHVRSGEEHIHNFYRPVKYTFKPLSFHTECFFAEDRGISKLFKERIDKSTNQESLKNPFDMSHSINFVFNDYSKTAQDASNNITISEGKLKLASGVTGTWISQEKATAITPTKCQVMVKGEAITGNLQIYVTFDGTDNFSVNPIVITTTVNGIPSSGETLITNQGAKARLKIVINSASTLIEAVGLYFKA